MYLILHQGDHTPRFFFFGKPKCVATWQISEDAFMNVFKVTFNT